MGPNVFIGCGGSGIGALRRLHVLLCEDRHWRTRMDEDVYYIVVDTELAEIRDFRAHVKRHAQGARAPMVCAIGLSQGVTSLQHPVTEAFGGRKAPDPLTDAPEHRHFGHWWYEPTTRDLYIASKLTEPITKGAGQCPAISFFLAWKEMKKIDEALQSVVAEILRRRATGAPLDQASFHVIAGLAGGTGRGCWNLLAFKLRQFMEGRLGDRTKVTAYLFDASVSKDRTQQRPGQKLAMEVNSLTGLSELACWMRNDGGLAGYPEPHLYRLPNLARPHDLESDVLEAHLELNAGYGARPVDYAYLVFGESPVAVLDKHEQFVEMVGTGLYASTTLEHIGKTGINDTIKRYRGLSAASFEISASTIRRYFEQRVRLRLLDAAGQSQAEAVGASAEKVLAGNGLLIALRSNNKGAYQADAHGDVLQRALDRLLARLRGRLENLDEAIQGDDPDEVHACLETLSQANPGDAAVAVSEALDSLSAGVAGAGTTQDKLRRVFEGAVVEMLRETLSLKAVEDFLDAASGRLQASLADLPEPHELELGEGLMKVFERAKGREGPWGLFGPHFSDEEREDLLQAARRAIAVAHYEGLRAALREAIDGLVQPFTAWKRACEAARRRLEAVSAQWREDLARDAGVGAGGDPFDSIFAPADDPRRGLPDKFAARRFIRRELRPVLTRSREQELLDDALKHARRDELTALLLRAVTDPAQSLAGDDYDLRRRFEEDLGAVVRRAASIPPHFVETHFSFRGVIDDLRKTWTRHFEEVRNDHDALNESIEVFRAYFGVEPERRRDEFELPDLKTFIYGMATSLARTCRPFWRAAEKGTTPDAVAVFLPHVGLTLAPEEAEKQLNEKLGAKTPVTVVQGEPADGSRDTPSNPFVLLVYALAGTDDLDHIENLKYYREPELKRWLALCERPEGSAWFETRDGQKGLGYTDARYVREPQLVAQRWKPWVPETGVDERVEADGIDALLYALFRPTGELAAKLAEIGWGMPLVEERTNRRLVFTREAFREPAETWKRDRAFQGDPRQWRPGDWLGQGLHRAFDALCGRGEGPKQGDSDWRQWRAVITEESRVFWDVVALELNAGRGTGNFREQMRAFEGDLADRFRAEAADSADRPVLDRLMQRVAQLVRG